METKILPISEISAAAVLLRQGFPVVFPTETVYGLGAAVFIPEAVSKIFSIKGRPADNPLIAHIHSLEGAEELCSELPSSFFLLAERFWPGPLAFVLQKKESVPLIISAGQPTIAIRMPDHPAALELIRQVGQPLAAPSANLSGRPSPTQAIDAWEDLQGKVALILDGGPCRIGIESTVLSLTDENDPVLLRPGSISQEELEHVLKKTIRLPKPSDPIASPGMKYRHYAPKAPVRLVFERKDIRASFVLSCHPKPGERLLTAKTLYAELREADRLEVNAIDIDCDASLQANAALFNRVVRASSI